MKNFKFFLPLAALGLLASCANDNLNQPNEGNNSGTKSAYLNLNLVLPSSPSSRAATFPTNSNADEYAVEDGALYLFDMKGNFVTSVELTLTAENGSTEIDQKEKQTKVVIPGISETDYYQALVILNKGGLTPPTSGTFTSWATTAQTTATMQIKVSVDNSQKDRYTMTNAPTLENGAVKVLVDVTPDNLYVESADATSANPVTVYVQRGVAKVTLATSDYSVGGDAKEVEGDSGDKVKLTEWYVANVNTTTFPVQNVTNSNDWTEGFNSWSWTSLTGPLARFTNGTSSIFTRIAWGVDPNYSTSASASSELTKKDASTSNNAAFYVLENTFDLKNMKKVESTMVVFKGEYQIKDKPEKTSFISFNDRIYAVEAVQKTGDEDKSGEYIFNEIVNPSDQELALAALGCKATDNINYYKDGEVYYYKPIRHFDDAELGFSASNKFSMPDDGYQASTTATETELKNYLGRYGVLRNNWYELKVNSISGPGKPTPTPDDDEWDDDPDHVNIDVLINILSWAKRSQDLDF